MRYDGFIILFEFMKIGQSHTFVCGRCMCVLSVHKDRVDLHDDQDLHQLMCGVVAVFPFISPLRRLFCWLQLFLNFNVMPCDRRHYSNLLCTKRSEKKTRQKTLFGEKEKSDAGEKMG